MPYHLGSTLHFFQFRVTTCWYARQFRGSQSAEHVKQATEVMLNACEINKQRVHVILYDNVEIQEI